MGASSDIIVKTAAMGKRIGIGTRPALLIIDMQIYMLGDKREPIEQSIKSYPSSCGERAWVAADHIAQLIRNFRVLGFPVIYTQQTLKANGENAGPYKAKREFLYGSQNWLIEETHGWEIAPILTPAPEDTVIKKTRTSAFFKTNLYEMLRQKQIDTLIVTGGSTSTCVRATVFDSASYDFRTVVASDGVCDRLNQSHEVNLRDMDRQMADVMTTKEIINALQKLNK